MNMLKLMIVDDESLFREALRKTIPWNDLGYEVCCEAENGFDALEKIAEYKPDVALVDINMPFMDGIELAAEIKESGMDIRVIIVTGYDEFNYARQAIEVGVENYLLKPINEEKLMKVLSSVKKKIDIKIHELKKKVSVYKPILKEMFLSNLLYGSRLFTGEELKNLKNSLETDMDNCPYQVVTIELCEKQEYGWNDDDRQLWIFAVLNIAAEVLSETCVFESCRDIHGRIHLVVQFNTIDANWPPNLYNLCERIRSLVSKHLNFNVTIGISNSHKGLKYLSKAYNEALYALKNSITFGENRVILYENVAVSEKAAGNVYPIEQRQQLLMSARMGLFDEVDKIIDSIFEELKLSNASSEIVIIKCMEMVSTCFEFISGTGNEIKSLLGDDFNLLKEVNSKKNIDEMKAWVKDIFFTAMKNQDAGTNSHLHKIACEAKKYIDDNISKFDLKVIDVARHVHVAYGYLCVVFKKEMGKTINAYITETRINKAKKMMDEGCRSVSLIAAKVGYTDANYFGKCFKKIYGITPGKYIENISVRQG